MQSIFTQSVGQSGLASPKTDQTSSLDGTAVRPIVGNSILPTFNVVFEEAVEADLRKAGPHKPEADVQGDTSAETDTPKPDAPEAQKTDTKPQGDTSITDEIPNRLVAPDAPLTHSTSLLRTEQSGQSKPSEQATIANSAPQPVDGLDHKMDVSASSKAMSESIGGHPQPEAPAPPIPTTIPRVTNSAAMMDVTQPKNTQVPAHVDFVGKTPVLPRHGMQSASPSQPTFSASSSVGSRKQASLVSTPSAAPPQHTVQTLAGNQAADIAMQPPVGLAPADTKKSTTLPLDQKAMPTREALPNANILQKAPTPLAVSKTFQMTPLVGSAADEQVTAPTLDDPVYVNRTALPQNAEPLAPKADVPMRFTKASEGGIIKMPKMTETSKAGISVSEARLQTVPVKTPATEVDSSQRNQAENAVKQKVIQPLFSEQITGHSKQHEVARPSNAPNATRSIVHPGTADPLTPSQTQARPTTRTPQLIGEALQNPSTSAPNARSSDLETPNSTQALDARPQTVQIDKQVPPSTLPSSKNALPSPQADSSKLTRQQIEISTPKKQAKDTIQNVPVSTELPRNLDAAHNPIYAGRTPLPASEFHIKEAAARKRPNAAVSELENAAFVSRKAKKKSPHPQLDVMQIAANRQVAQPDTETTLHQVIRLKGEGPIAPKDAAVLSEKAAKTLLRTPVRSDQLPAFTPPQTATSQIVVTPKPEPRVFGKTDETIQSSQPVITTNSGFVLQPHTQEKVSRRRGLDEPWAAPPSTNYTQATGLNQTKAKYSMALQTLTQSANFNQFEEQSRLGTLTHSDSLMIPKPDALQTTQAPTNAAATRMDLALHVSRQVMEVVQHLPNKPVEISLNPDELGRLRLAVSTSDAGLVVNVVAERPETLDLLRKHISLLGQEFQALGYDDVAFSFNGSGDFEDSAGTGQENTPGGSTTTAEPEVIPRDTSIQKSTGETGLDLRL